MHALPLYQKTLIPTDLNSHLLKLLSRHALHFPQTSLASQEKLIAAQQDQNPHLPTPQGLLSTNRPLYGEDPIGVRVEAVDLRRRGKPSLHSFFQEHRQPSQRKRASFPQGRDVKSSLLQPRPTYLSLTIKTAIHQAQTQQADPLKIPNPAAAAHQLLQDLPGSLILITFHPTSYKINYHAARQDDPHLPA